MSDQEALSKYSLTKDELAQFEAILNKYGFAGLRTTRSSEYPVVTAPVPQDQELPDEISVGDITIVRKTYVVKVAGEPVKTTKKEFGILELLMINLKLVVSCEMFLKHLYDDKGLGRPNVKIIEVFMCKLRKKIDSQDSPTHIENVWGRGYRFATQGNLSPAEPE